MNMLEMNNKTTIPFVRLTAFTFLLALSTTAYAQYPRLMQGPMLGAVTPTEISVWIRTSGPFGCILEVDKNHNFSHPRQSEMTMTSKHNDYCAVLQIGDLQPGTRYYYRVLVNGKVDDYQQNRAPLTAHTAPAEGTAGSFRIAFGTCARFQRDRIQKIWGVIGDWNPDLFFWLGDNIYGDTLDSDILAEEYRRQRDLPHILSFLANVPQLSIWDDHDYGTNNSDRTNPIKEDALEVFKLYWPNPSYGLPEVPGVFFKYSYGGVDFFFLDDRYYRDPNSEPDHPEKTHLGKAQKEWLQNELLASTSPFKVILSGGGWSKAKGAGGDSWASYLHERNALFDFIRDQEIEGVVLVSGDTHVGELNAIPWSDRGGYDLYDLGSSPLAQSTGKSWVNRRPEIRIRPVYFSGGNFGLIEFDLQEEPKLRFQLIDEYGYSVWEPFELYASELVNGKKTWPQKIDPVELKRYRNWKEGKGYYQ